MIHWPPWKRLLWSYTTWNLVAMFILSPQNRIVAANTIFVAIVTTLTFIHNDVSSISQYLTSFGFGNFTNAKTLAIHTITHYAPLLLTMGDYTITDSLCAIGFFGVWLTCAGSDLKHIYIANMSNDKYVSIITGAIKLLLLLTILHQLASCPF